MLRLRSALESIATALEAPSSLRSMIAELERTLAHALTPAHVTICVQGESIPPDAQSIALRLDGGEIGALLLRAAPPALQAELEEVLRLLAAPISAAIGYRRRPERRGREGQPANTDALCRIPNRQAFDEYMPDAWERAKASGTPLVMAFIDVDFFKTYNDRYGHVEGDRCLQQVASLLVKRRAGDESFAARFGGEEFVLVFEDMTLERTIAEIQHIFDRLEALNIEHAGTTLGRVSMTAGIATALPAAACSTIELVDDADRALYQAKRFGRNRICAGPFVSKGPVVAKLRTQQRAHAAADVPSFGRDDDVARILSALRHARVLTLVGPRGIGKSRLLALVADEAASRLHRPVIFVESELLRSGMDPATALASACDLTLESGRVLETVTDFLADREAIVILDDIDDARDEIQRLCRHLCVRTSGVSIVSAALAPLGILAERTIVVPPLDEEAALQLLTFHLGGDASGGRAIVRYLGGNPASIETTSGWVGRLGAAEVLDRLAMRAGGGLELAEVGALFSDAAHDVP